ncbi:MAG: UDP-3-O-acyl-N-acetylglucosamine deacetylase [Phycisphaerales bacterium]|nr:UDP-3-O-acyl-N-acetylglucosamine deacetylase [Phycisphaerales bacterium]MCB9835809.1 UDP-3-O-acyl-N-acetylglucosamine deacetylase [Phycisphaera sp.]
MTSPLAPRRTPAAPVTVEGTGLFTDSPARCTIEPAEAGAGIVFVHNSVEIPASIERLAPSPITAFAALPARHTCLALDTARVITCEHVLSALVGLGVTDARVTLGDSGELPIGDGSANLFADAIAAVGVHTLDYGIVPITLQQPIAVRSGSATIAAEPSDAPSYAYHFEPPEGSPLTAQSASWTGNPDDYLKDIAPARTFSMLAEANQAKALGLFTSFTPKDLLVLDDATGMPIDNAFRFESEPARHKLLDLIGDLALAGRPIYAKITATRSGHALNHEMARRLFEAP